MVTRLVSFASAGETEARPTDIPALLRNLIEFRDGDWKASGIRVRDLDRALNFYRVLGFDLLRRAEGDDVAIVRNGNGVELNLIFNANACEPGPNVLMDVPEKYPGYTHMALRVGSLPATIAALKAKLPGVSFASLQETELVYKLVEMRTA